MYEFVTVVEFTWPTDAAIPKALLDAAGIENRLKDELTVQVYNLYSNAIGGVKLQVPPAEFERAREVLRGGGFIKEGISEDLSFWLELDRITKQIPLLGRVEVLIARLLTDRSYRSNCRSRTHRDQCAAFASGPDDRVRLVCG